MACLFWILVSVIVVGGLCCCAVAGFRNGDRPADARVSAELRAGAGGRPVVVATIRNPAGTPVLAALRTRRPLLPAWLADPHAVVVPRWTVRRTFRACSCASVGVVPAGGALEFPVPAVPAGRGWLLTAAIGQEGGRLRVHRVRVSRTWAARRGRRPATRTRGA
jgi:hypothetical protein